MIVNTYQLYEPLPLIGLGGTGLNVLRLLTRCLHRMMGSYGVEVVYDVGEHTGVGAVPRVVEVRHQHPRHAVTREHRVRLVPLLQLPQCPVHRPVAPHGPGDARRQCCRQHQPADHPNKDVLLSLHVLESTLYFCPSGKGG